jgi:6-pyruvoyltetrahydropterin/6-carboxytetrahydropterin synthase
MPTVSLTRRVAFSAAHRYSRPDWSDDKNRATFGSCAEPNYHGHNYVCEITVSGPLDETTGFVMDLGALDKILDAEIMAKFDHRNINLEVPEFAEGKLIPSGENLARYIYERVQKKIGATPRVTRVKVAEDRSLSSTYEP